MLRKIMIFIVFVAVLFSSFSAFCVPAAAFELDNEDDVEAYYLYNFENETVMAQKNPDSPISLSSTVKIMTVCLALESNIPRDQMISVTKDMLKGVSGRFMGLNVGDRLTFEDLLYATACGSFNDAAQALAISVCGSLDEFVDKMNEKANQLGMDSTLYSDVTGMASVDKDTTLSDIVLLAKYMTKNEEFVKITSTRSYKLSDEAECEYRTINNRSSLLSSYKGLSNFNTGSSGDLGDSSVSYYTDGELSFLCIVMNATASDDESSTNYAEMYSKELLSHAFYDYSFKTVISKKTVIDSLPVDFAISTDEIGIYLQDDLKIFLPDDIEADDLTYNIYIFGSGLSAPLTSGDTVGVISVSQNGKFLASAPLIVKETVDRNAFLYIMQLMKDYVMGRTFLITILAFAFMMILYYLLKRRHLDRMFGRSNGNKRAFAYIRTNKNKK